MYRSLDADQIVQTCRATQERITALLIIVAGVAVR